MKKWLVSIYKKSYTLLEGRGLGKLAAVRAVNRFIISRLKSPVAVVDGHKMFLDPGDTLKISVRGAYEPFETEIAKEEIKPGDTVLDIGANIGYYTLIFAKLVGEEGKVYAFEPEPANFALLKRNIEANGYKNVVLVQKAVSNETGKIRLYMSKRGAVDHRIYDSGDGRQYTEIESVTLDDYFGDENSRIDFIKMDIQGAEGKAIKGMGRLLIKNPGIKLMMEFSPVGLARQNMDPAEVLKSLSAYGFTLSEIVEHEKKARPVTIEELLKKYTPARNNCANLLLMKGK